jgi:hypothetical protein
MCTSINVNTGIRACRPWDFTGSLFIGDDGLWYRKWSISDEWKKHRSLSMVRESIEDLKIVYKLLKENYSVMNSDISEALERKVFAGEVDRMIDTLTTTGLPIWSEQDDYNGNLRWFGVLDREKHSVPELEGE